MPTEHYSNPATIGTFGSDGCFADEGGTERDCRQYNSDGTYATTQYEFTDKSKRNPVKVVLNNAEHEPFMEADYE